jgi:hypothetical protein
LLSASAVRERAHELLGIGLDGGLPNFIVDLERLAAAADFVAAVIREAYPNLAVPLHSRWRHFVVGRRDLWNEIARDLYWRTRACAEFDLATLSVLLDAGAGVSWRYRDVAGFEVGRSEGIAVASLRMFEAGCFSADKDDPLRADAERLKAITVDELGAGMQVGTDNPLPGLEGRAALLSSLGAAIEQQPSVFETRDGLRPCGLIEYFWRNGAMLAAPEVLRALLDLLGGVWPGRLRIGGVALGDTWRHPAIRRDDATDGLVPLHKLSQWLAYSLIAPLQRAGFTVTHIGGLTGLAEYRNGGLFVDSGVLRLRDAEHAAASHSVAATLVVEWRALTVALLDRIAPLVRARLGVDDKQLPLASILEGGTWAAGRRLARQMRDDGAPPIRVDSDGTVF